MNRPDTPPATLQHQVVPKPAAALVAFHKRRPFPPYSPVFAPELRVVLVIDFYRK